LKIESATFNLQHSIFNFKTFSLLLRFQNKNVHTLEPYYNWRDRYIAAEDNKSPFYGMVYDEFTFSTKIYNYYIHPQWDDIGSQTLYVKVIYANYEEGFGIIEMIGEWNDCINNDIMFFKNNLVNRMMKEGISRFILIGENVLNFHFSDDCYYEEWYEETSDEGGWIVALNFRQHVIDEMNQIGLGNYLFFGGKFNTVNWRTLKPLHFCNTIDELIMKKLT